MVLFDENTTGRLSCQQKRGINGLNCPVGAMCWEHEVGQGSKSFHR